MNQDPRSPSSYSGGNTGGRNPAYPEQNTNQNGGNPLWPEPGTARPGQNTGYPNRNEAFSGQQNTGYSDPNAAWPGQNTARRTAGSGTGMQTPEGDSVRDWQRNTWYGPAPRDVNPFDEPEDAPELRESRSENVNRHIGDFWRADTTGYQYGGKGQNTGRTPRSSRNGPRAPRQELRFSTVMKALGILLCVVVVSYLVLRFVVFTVREIKVTGNRNISAEEIIRQSGIRMGESMLTLSGEAVEKRLEENYRLEFRYLEKDFPTSVTLSVREREACCWLTYGGILYFMDKNCMVMYETEDLTVQPAELVEVKGLVIRSGCQTGQTMVLAGEAQQEAFSGLFLEMKVLGCTAQMAEADFSNTEALLLVTRDGYTVALGSAANIHAKLRAALLVREKLISMELTGGTINVINPESPLYSPSAV